MSDINLLEGFRSIVPEDYDYDYLWKNIREYFTHGETASRTSGVTPDYPDILEKLTKAVLGQNYNSLADDKVYQKLVDLWLTFTEEQNEDILSEGHKSKVFTSSPYSKTATEDLEFEEVGRIDYENLKDSDGKSIFDDSELASELPTTGVCSIL